MRLCTLFLKWLLCGLAPLSAQGDFRTFESLELPLIGSSADHAVVAMNDAGDLFVAWTAVKNGGERHVDGVFIRRTAAMSWAIPTQLDVVKLGDASLGILDTVDRCWKPDVVSVGDNFVVTWPRINPTSQDARLEVARIVVTPNQSAVVDSPSVGEGYVVDDQVYGGTAGVMPDLARLQEAHGETDLAAVAYVHESGNSGSQVNYIIRGTILDFRGPSPVFDPPDSLISKVAIDEASAIPFTGGRVLPDLVEDDAGYLVLAYEEFGRFGGVLQGRVVLRRLIPLAGGGFQRLEFTSLQGPNPAVPQRRPMLDTTSLDGDNTVSVTWVEVLDAVTEDVDTFAYELDYFGLTFPQAPTVTDLGYSNLPGWADNRPIPVHGRAVKGMLVGRFNATQTSDIYGWLPGPPAKLPRVPFGALEPVRPAADLLEDAGIVGLDLIPIVCESLLSQGSNPKRIYLLIANL